MRKEKVRSERRLEGWTEVGCQLVVDSGDVSRRCLDVVSSIAVGAILLDVTFHLRRSS